MFDVYEPDVRRKADSSLPAFARIEPSSEEASTAWTAQLKELGQLQPSSIVGTSSVHVVVIMVDGTRRVQVWIQAIHIWLMIRKERALPDLALNTRSCEQEIVLHRRQFFLTRLERRVA